MEPCPSCPVAGLGVTCHAIAVQVSRFCDLIAMGRSDYAALMIQLSTGKPPADPCPPAATDPAARRAAKPRLGFNDLARLKANPPHR